MKKGTNIKKLRHELLEKLVNEYEQNECIGHDPYKKFSEIIQKLNFGIPFVDHVAKKTYIKSKIGSSNNEIEEYKINDEYIISESEEEEYQKLLAEFG